MTERMQEYLKEIPLEYLNCYYYQPGPVQLSERGLDRRMRVLRYLEKKKRKADHVRTGYELRRTIAKNRVRHKGRFVKRTEARQILKNCRAASQ
jgi:hypothetical protein